VSYNHFISDLAMMNNRLLVSDKCF